MKGEEKMSMHRDNLARKLPQQQTAATTYAPQTDARKAVRSAESKALAREKLLWLGTILICIAIAIGLVMRYASMAGLSYQIEEQKLQFQKLKEEQMKLEMQVLELESAERIKDYATNKLGMKQVDDKSLVILPGDGN